MLQTMHYTDWMYRPRLPAELDTELGGGPVFRQASHQVDIVRYIAGGLVRSVRAMVVQLDAARGAPGAYIAYLEFEDGTPATVVYSGYGHFAMDELLNGQRPPTDLRRKTLEDEAAQKEARRFTVGKGQPSGRVGVGVGVREGSLGLFGLTLVTCERGDLRESADGLYLYRDGERHQIPVPREPRGAAELEEMYQAVRHGKPIVHDGRWGEATLEVCLAIHESARTRAEVRMTQQTAVPAP
jgi:phthalate 4,5-cis-dihydrodiol dehydrogenase